MGYPCVLVKWESKAQTGYYCFLLFLGKGSECRCLACCNGCEPIFWAIPVRQEHETVSSFFPFWGYTVCANPAKPPRAFSASEYTQRRVAKFAVPLLPAQDDDGSNFDRHRTFSTFRAG